MCHNKNFSGKNYDRHITKNEIIFCFWNVGGITQHGVNKMEDDMFLSEVIKHDIILLAETHIGYETPPTLEGYNYFPVCRPISGNNRYFGGLALFIRKSIKKHVSILTNTNKDYQWIKLDSSFFNLKKDLYLCLVYYPPAQSVYIQKVYL